MNKMIKIAWNKPIKGEQGQVLILVLILLVVGGLIVTPLLAFMGTGLKAGQVYEAKAGELYAADAGIEDSLWQINNGQLATVLTSPSAYDVYDYSTTWDYILPEQINSKAVAINIQNVWIPDMSVPIASQARGIIEALKLVVAGSVPAALDYQIRINFSPGAGEENDLDILTLGIWLPPGFSYDPGSSNLEGYYSTETISSHAGGEAVVWTFGGGYPFDNFPGPPTGSPMTSDITFNYSAYTASQTGLPEALAWVTTSGVADIPFSWDADTSVYQMTSTAGGTTVEAYSIKSGVRELVSAIAGDFFATGNTLMEAVVNYQYRDRLYNETSATVDASDIPSDATIEAAWLYWSGWQEEATEQFGQVIWSDDGSSFSNWTQTGSDWVISSGRFRGHDTGNTQYHSNRYLAMSSSRDLSSYASGTVKVSWQQDEDGGLDDTDRLYFEFSADGGSNWDGLIEAFRDDNPPSSFSYIIPDAYLTANFRMRFYLDYFGGSGEYAYIDDITLSQVIWSDDGSSFTNWTAGSAWEVYSGAFRGYTYGKSSPGRYLTMSSSRDLSSYSGQAVTVSWQQWENGTLESSDALQFQFSGDGGSSWGSLITAFSDNIGSSPQSFSYTVPDAYLTANFRMRYYLDYFGGSGEYAYIDDITIFESEPLTEAAKVNRVMFGTAGNMSQVTAATSQVAPTADASGAPDSWSYSSFADVTSLVNQLITDGDLSTNGSGTYTLGHVLEGTGYTLYPTGETGYPLATPGTSQWTYAGWSLILVYSSPDTEGHQLYLFDDLRYVGLSTTVSFDISGFLAPDDTTGSHLTYFVGEGDSFYAGDNAAVNGTYLSDADNPSDNVFNSYSNVLSAANNPTDGIDIDDFDMSSYINPGDTTAEVELYNGEEIYNLVYIILSFRSDVSPGGSILYLIK